jgi:hypothetical protein
MGLSRPCPLQMKGCTNGLDQLDSPKSLFVPLRHDDRGSVGWCARILRKGGRQLSPVRHGVTRGQGRVLGKTSPDERKTPALRDVGDQGVRYVQRCLLISSASPGFRLDYTLRRPRPDRILPSVEEQIEPSTTRPRSLASIRNMPGDDGRLSSDQFAAEMENWQWVERLAPCHRYGGGHR